MNSYNSYHKKNKKIKIENTLQGNLDKFIQSCLNKFEFVEPIKELYETTGEDNNYIISHKSTIPDLVIWNKTFNKNECFADCSIKKNNPFPRFKFYLRLNKSKETKKSHKKRKNNIQNHDQEEELSNKTNDKNMSLNHDENINENKVNDSKDLSEIIVHSIEKMDLNSENIHDEQEFSSESGKQKKEKNLNKSSHSNKNENISINTNDINKYNIISNIDKKNNNDIQYYPTSVGNNQNLKTNINDNNNTIILFNNENNNINQLTPNTSLLNNNYYRNNSYCEYNYMNNNSNKKNNKIYQNKFSIPSSKNKKSMTDYYQNQFKQNELLMNYVYSSLQVKGWIIFKVNGSYISNFTSFELFSFLTNILKDNIDLNNYVIGMINNSMMFNGEEIYIILSQTLPIILQKKQIELMQNETNKKQKLNQEKEKEKEKNSDDNGNNSNNDVICEQEGFNYDFNINKSVDKIENNNCEEENMENKNDYEISEKDDFNFDLNSEQNEHIDNNFFLYQQQDNKYDNFDSSIFGQNHQ